MGVTFFHLPAMVGFLLELSEYALRAAFDDAVEFGKLTRRR